MPSQHLLCSLELFTLICPKRAETCNISKAQSISMLRFHNQSNGRHRFIKYLWYPTNAMILMDQLCTKVFIQVPSLKDNTSVFIPCDFCREKKVHKIFVLNIISRVMSITPSITHANFFDFR